MYCKLCGTIITDENKSSEHIIHNAIGGIFEDSYIYCKDCNGKYGTDQDKAFTDIFIPFVEELKIHKSRKTKGTVYRGIMYDDKGKIYHVEYQAGKVRTIRDEKGNFVGHQPRVDMVFGGFEFNLDNEALKKGLAKIAFNYAVHNGIGTDRINRLFDDRNKKLVDKPMIIPFISMTPFDAIMEACKPQKLFHALRLFNNGSYLFVYIELFSTFQFYVLVTDEYAGDNLDMYYCNYIEKNEVPDEKLRDELTPHSLKDAQIIMQQYGLNQDEIQQHVKGMPAYSDEDKSANWSLLCREIGKRAYEVWRKQSYERDYREVVNNIYNTARLIDVGDEMMQTAVLDSDIKGAVDFMQSFQFYTVYDEDCVDMANYKRILPDGRGYPEAICEMIKSCDSDVVAYTRSKFRMLEERIGL